VKQLIALLLILCSCSLFAFEKLPLAAYSGKVSYQKGYPYLKTKDDQSLHLLLAPKNLLDSLNVTLVQNQALKVSGWLKGKELLVRSLNIGSRQIHLRNAYQKPLYPFHSQRSVDLSRCISCWLCIKNCPVGAISRKNGKAYIDPAKCIECGICSDGNGRFQGCPVSAIKEHKE